MAKKMFGTLDNIATWVVILGGVNVLLGTWNWDFLTRLGSFWTWGVGLSGGYLLLRKLKILK